MQRLLPDGFSLTTAQVFGILYVDYQQPIKRYLFVKWVHNQDIADDLCQETFKSFWVFISRKGTALPLTADHNKYLLYKLYKFADYRAIDYLRKTKGFESIPLPEDEAHTQSPELVVEGIENQIIGSDRLQKALAEMPQKQHEMLALVACGFTNKWIAAKYGISESRVSQIVNRGKAQLHREYYPVAHSFQQEALIFCQDLKELYRDINDDYKLLEKSLPRYGNGPLPYELRQWMVKSGEGIIGRANSLKNTLQELSNKGDLRIIGDRLNKIYIINREIEVRAEKVRTYRASANNTIKLVRLRRKRLINLK